MELSRKLALTNLFLLIDFKSGATKFLRLMVGRLVGHGHLWGGNSSLARRRGLLEGGTAPASRQLSRPRVERLIR